MNKKRNIRKRNKQNVWEKEDKYEKKGENGMLKKIYSKKQQE